MSEINNEETESTLQDKLDYLNQTKADLKEAIESKGQTIESTTTFREYVEKVEAISTGIETQDATAIASDILFPKVAYARNQRIVGSIQSTYETTSGGMTYDSIALTSSQYILDINEEFQVALVGSYNTTNIKIYTFVNNALGTLLDTIYNSYFSSSYGNILSAQVSKKLNVQGNLNIFIYQKTSDSATGYISVVQFNTTTKVLLPNTKASRSVNAIASRYVGGLSVNPMYPDICAIATQYYTINGTSACVAGYNPVSCIFDKYLALGHFHGGGVTGDVCEWDSTGRYLLHCTSKLTPQYAIIEALNSSFTEASVVLDLARGASAQSSDTLCLWNNQYYFYNNTLRNMSNTTVKTYSEFSAYYNNNLMWTYDNYLFITDYTQGKLKCFKINTDLSLTACFSVNITTTKPIDPAKYNLGCPQAPQSNQHMYFKDMGSSGFKFSFLQETRVLRSLDNGMNIFYNTDDANISASNVLSGKIGYGKNGKVTGTMPHNGSVTITPSTTNQTIAQGYHTGNGKVLGDPNLISKNISQNISIFGILGIAPMKFTTIEEMQTHTDYEEGTIAVVYNEGYLGTYEWKNNTWTLLEFTQLMSQAYDILNQVTGTPLDPLTGSGGSSEEIELILNEIINGSEEE